MTKDKANDKDKHNDKYIYKRLVTFETFDQSDEEIWPDQQKDNDKDKCNEKDKDNGNWRTPSKNNLRDLW